MRTITALFDTTYDHAASAVRAVKDAGIDSGDISIVANNSAQDVAFDDNSAEEGAAAGAGVGAVAGGGAGLLAGIGALAIPGIGPVIAVAGYWRRCRCRGRRCCRRRGRGLLGALANAGVPESEAHVYAEGVRRGGALVSVRADDARADTVGAILRNAAGVESTRVATTTCRKAGRASTKTPRPTPKNRSATTAVPMASCRRLSDLASIAT